MSSDATTAGAAGDAADTADLGDASRRLLEESFTEGKFDLADQMVAPDAVNHDPALPADMRGLSGPDAVKRTASVYRAAFPDLRMTVDDVITSGEKVVLRWHSEGTHRGELAGFAPTGVHASVTGVSIDLWKDGKIVETWTEWDNLGLARQLGGAPPEGSIGEKVGMGLQWVIAQWMRRKNAP
jgi:steroid delta-isomerase-like uncharacterized protein